MGLETSAVAKASPRRVRAPVTAPANDDGLGALYELANQAEAAPRVPDAARCPQCKSRWDDQAVFCTNCGYDSRTGKALSPVAAASPSTKPSARTSSSKKPKQPIDYMAPQGSFLIGLVMSAAFALAASIVWIAVAWLTGFAIGYIAILIGAAAGLGMRIGQKGFSSIGGTAASGMTLLAILLAKFTVLELLISKHGPNASIYNIEGAKLGYYFLNPIGLIIIVVGMGTAFRTANGSVKT